MRFVLVAVIAIVVLGAVAAYSRFVSSIARPVSPVRVYSAVNGVVLEIEATFEPTGDGFDQVPLTIWLNGEPVSAHNVEFCGRFSRRVRLEKWRNGTNRLYVRAVGRASASGPLRALRLQLWRSETPAGEVVFWSAPGEPVSGTWKVALPGESTHGD